jgi:hypothetical protein
MMGTDTERELRDALHAVASRVHSPADLRARVDRRMAAQRRCARLAGGLTAAALVVVLLAATAVLRGSDEDDAKTATATETPADFGPVVVLEGEHSGVKWRLQAGRSRETGGYINLIWDPGGYSGATTPLSGTHWGVTDGFGYGYVPDAAIVVAIIDAEGMERRVEPVPHPDFPGIVFFVHPYKYPQEPAYVVAYDADGTVVARKGREVMDGWGPGPAWDPA